MKNKNITHIIKAITMPKAILILIMSRKTVEEKILQTS